MAFGDIIAGVNQLRKAYRGVFLLTVTYPSGEVKQATYATEREALAAVQRLKKKKYHFHYIITNEVPIE
jgi:hypothetical protein